MLNWEIYRIGRNLGLNKNDIDIVLNTPNKISNIQPTTDLYKNGTDYGTISPRELYKVGTRYGTLSTKDF